MRSGQPLLKAATHVDLTSRISRCRRSSSGRIQTRSPSHAGRNKTGSDFVGKWNSRSRKGPRLDHPENADTLDAIIAGVNIQELDPNDQSVGLGGFPNEEGVVQLDASCMHGPTRRAGAVGALEDIATPSLVAKAIMDYTDHIMLVGKDAKRFALEMGFKEQNLSHRENETGLVEVEIVSQQQRRVARSQRSGEDQVHDGNVQHERSERSGRHLFSRDNKRNFMEGPGRVGDSAIIGAGQYCDNTAGAAGATGRGESNIKICGAFYIVELMRQECHRRQPVSRLKSA